MLRMVLMAGQSGSVLPAVTWNPSDKSSRVTLSSGNLLATANSDAVYGSVRATLAKTFGKHYFEVLVEEASVSNFVMIGVATAAQLLDSYVGNGVYGWAYYQETGVKTHNAANEAFGAPYTSGDVIGVHLDMDAGSAWFSKNGAVQGGGNPVLGTGPAFTGLSGAVFPAISLYRSSSPAHSVRGRFRMTDFGYAPAAGYAAWGG